MKSIHENARQLMKGYCRVCPRCDGKACAGEVPGMGGVGTAAAFKANLTALERLTFNMRLIHDVTDPDTTTALLGMNLALPLLAAPIGGVSFNMGGKITEQAYIEAIVHGCRAKGILGCTGDGVPDFIHESGFEAIRQAQGDGIPFIKPWEDRELFDKLQKAEQTGARIVGMDIDAAGLITLRKMGRPVAPKPLDALKKIIDATPMKFVLKGVMTPDEALLAVEAGADAIVVSNHGGRVLDHTPGAARVLPAIIEQVKGKIAILVDGGVRTGGDVLKLVALGADAVMIGRPFSIACVGGLQQGVETYIDTIHGELKQTMVLTGTASLAKATPAILNTQETLC